MEIVLGTCSRLRARISETQCSANRSRGVFACAGCPGLDRIESVSCQAAETQAPVKHILPVSRVVSDSEAVPRESKIMSIKGTCTTCSRPDMTLPIKDTCGRCQYRIKNGRDPITNALVNVHNRQKSTKILPMDDQNSDGTLRADRAILADDETETGVLDRHKNVESMQKNVATPQKNVLQTAVQKTKKSPPPSRRKPLLCSFQAAGTGTCSAGCFQLPVRSAEL